MVRAKFYCASKAEHGFPGNPQKSHSVELYPVTSGSEENKQFFQSSPSGKLELRIVNPAAADLFEPGQEYYIDFTPVNK